MYFRPIYIYYTLIFFFAFNAEILQAEKIVWASKVIGFSSEYSSPKYSADQILGKPSVMPDFGSSPAAWMPAGQTGSEEWIHVGFSEKTYTRQIAILENFNPGAISRIYLLDSLQNTYLVYESQPAKETSETGRMFNININLTPYRVYSLMLYVDTKFVDNCQIDAIAISDSEIPVIPKINGIDEFVIDTTIKPENLGEYVNSEYFELAPVISLDGRTIFFTRDGHPDNFGIEKKQDVWFSVINDESKFQLAENIGDPINNDYSNFAFSISPEGKALLLGNIYNPDGTMSKGLSISYFSKNGWSQPKPLIIKNYYNLGNSSAYFLASNGKILLMSVEREDSYGGLDLYICFLEKDKTWSEPVNLGPSVNTAADEVSPFLAADGITLYYSTSGFPGYGQRDLFITRRTGESFFEWSEPVNLGPQLNTHGGDAYFNIPASGEYAYYISNENSFGSDDIFRVELPEKLKPKPVALISGKVINKITNQPVESKIIYEILPEGKEAGIAQSVSIDGEYKIVLPTGYMYGFLAQADSFISVHDNIDLRNLQKYTEIRRDLYLIPLEEGFSVSLNNIFFEFNKAVLLKESFSELNRITQLLKSNYNIKIEIRGHTDSIGTDIRNLDLSKRRAQAVFDYLVSKGISSNRLWIKAFGESLPDKPNDSEENMRKNRRVEFIIVEK